MKRELQALKVTPTNLLLSNCTFISFELLNLVNDKLQLLNSLWIKYPPHFYVPHY